MKAEVLQNKRLAKGKDSLTMKLVRKAGSELKYSIRVIGRGDNTAFNGNTHYETLKEASAEFKDMSRLYKALLMAG